MKCEKCNDLGILRVQVEAEKADALICCQCETGKAQFWDLPQLNRQIAGAMKVSQCPLEWFLPKNKARSIPRGRMSATVGPVIIAWKARVHEAEKFWLEWGPLLAPEWFEQFPPKSGSTCKESDTAGRKEPQNQDSTQDPEPVLNSPGFDWLDEKPKKDPG